MFGRLFAVRVKSAEKALKQGRLDEAFRLATSPDIRQQSQGGEILKRLADRFMERARQHLEQERFAEALHDLNKAEAGGVRLDEISELRRNIQTVADEVNRQAISQRRRIEKARRHVEEGSLVQGRRVLADADEDDHEARRLASDIEQREARAVQGFEQVEKLLKEKQPHAAIARFLKIRHLDPHATKAVALESAICAQVIGRVTDDLRNGRIARAVDELNLLGPLCKSLPARRDAEESLELVRAGSAALNGSDYDAAHRHLLRLQRVMPRVDWIKRACADLEQVDKLLTSLHSGPLGEHAKSLSPANGGRQSSVASLADTVVMRDRVASTDDLPDRLLMLVDDGGSYLLLRKPRVAIGRAMTSQPADIPIQSDLAERHAEISCVDDDFFLFSERDIDVDARSTRHQLLRDGNRVSLSSNAKFTFRTPHRQSPSSVLELSTATKVPNGVRRVVLFRGTAMIGAGRTAHVRCPSLMQDLVLFERSGRLWLRPQRRGGVDTEARAVAVGEQIEFGNLSFVIQPWPSTTAGPRFS